MQANPNTRKIRLLQGKQESYTLILQVFRTFAPSSMEFSALLVMVIFYKNI